MVVPIPTALSSSFKKHVISGPTGCDSTRHQYMYSGCALVFEQSTSTRWQKDRWGGYHVLNTFRNGDCNLGVWSRRC
jgi:hypothetical protein